MTVVQRVLYFSRDFTTHDQRFLSSLATTDYEVMFLRLENKNTRKPEEVLPNTIRILPALNQNKSFHYIKTFDNIKKLKEIIYKYQPDLIHAGPIQSCAFLSALSGFSPLVSMSWGSDILVESTKNLFFKLLTKFTLKNSTHFLGDSETVKKKAIQFGFPENKITLFPWGIDLESFHPGKNENFRTKIGWNDKFIILSLRSWEKIYGVDLVVLAFIEALESTPDLRLLLLGDGSQRETINQLISINNISEKIIFGGIIEQNELPNYYQAADLYLSASYSDGSSVSLMEALGCGLPVLVSDIPSNIEWIKKGSNGWLFKTGSVENLKNKIIEIFNNREKLESVRKEARLTAEEKANWIINFQKLMDAYNFAFKTADN